MKTYDVIIIGAGPAGLTAAIYAARYKLSVLVIGKLFGGLASEASKVCNFPSYTNISGFELMKKMLEQVRELGVEIKQEEVKDIKKGFSVITNKNTYHAKKIILAIGSERRKLQLENEKKFMGRGISYCATCDANFYKDKLVAVVGGSNAALSTALLLSKTAKKVFLIHRTEKFTAQPAWAEEVKKNKKIQIIPNSIITKLKGKEKLEEIELNNKKNLKVDGLFIEIGSVPNIELAEKLKAKVNEKGYIIVDKFQRTNVAGVFAAGDITNNPLKQIVTACAEGAIASDTVYREMR